MPTNSESLIRFTVRLTRDRHKRLLVLANMKNQSQQAYLEKLIDKEFYSINQIDWPEDVIELAAKRGFKPFVGYWIREGDDALYLLDEVAKVRI